MAIVYKHMKNAMLFSVDYNQSTSNKTFSLKNWDIFKTFERISRCVLLYKFCVYEEKVT